VTLVSTELAAVEPDTGYSPWGLTGLREVVADHVTGWGLPTSVDEIVITTGAQQGISAAAACWLRSGDTVVVEDPSYPGAIAAFAGDASVAVLGSLSKLFWGGLRLGWVRAPAALAVRFARVKATHDLGSSAVSQVLAERLLRAPEAERRAYLDGLRTELRS